MHNHSGSIAGRYSPSGKGNVIADIFVCALYVENYELIRRTHHHGLSNVQLLRSFVSLSFETEFHKGLPDCIRRHSITICRSSSAWDNSPLAGEKSALILGD